MTLDITTDMQVFDNLQTVTYQRRDSGGTTTTAYTGVSALRRAIRGHLSGVGGMGTAYLDAARWHLQSSTLAVVPRRGDRIVSTTDGTWEVADDEVVTLDSRYVVNCKKVAA